MGFPGGSAGEESSCSSGDVGLIPGLGRSLVEGHGYPLQCSGLENSVGCIVHGVPKSQIGQTSDFNSLNRYMLLRKQIKEQTADIQ